jgi:2-hydroxy-3-oxopropionate reductase
MKIGFIGLGIMGKHMARNLLKAGHRLIAYDIVRQSVDEIAAAGAEAGNSPRHAAEQSGIVITMLPNSPQVKEVVCGANGVLEGAAAGTILIDMSSIAPQASREICAACEAKGVIMLDAPVSGGEPKAADGSLSIMVGGRKDIFDQVKDGILGKVGASAVYCGEIGSGNAAKLVNQIIVACNIAACAEAFTLAKKSGVDPKVVFEAIKGGLAGSAVMSAKLPMMLERGYKPGFKIDLHIKDLSNAVDTGHSTGSPLPLTAMVMEMLQTVHAGGGGQNDHSALAKYYELLSGVSIGD